MSKIKNSNFNEKRKEKKKFKIPTSFTILFMVLVFIMVLSWILHYSGVHTEVTHEGYYDEEKSIWIPEHKTDEKIVAIGIVDLFVAIFRGFSDKVQIIVFVMSIGAFIFIVMKSKALDAMTQKIAWKFKERTIWAIPIIITFLSFCGSAYGMAEEALGFHMIVIPLLMLAGFDSFTAIITVLLGVGIGPMLATFDPFLIFTAVDAANDGIGSNAIQTTDGLVFRIIAWLVITTFTSAYVMMYAYKVKKDPQKSYTFSTHEEDKRFFLKEQVAEIPLTKKRLAINIIFLLLFIIMIVYLFPWDTLFSLEGDNSAKGVGQWIHKYIPFLTGLVPGWGSGGLLEVAGFFLIGSLVVAVINWEGEEIFVQDVLTGAKDIVGVGFIIAIAGAITIILKDTLMQSLMLGAINSEESSNSMNPFLFIMISFLVFFPLSFALPSTSGFSYAVFPIWGPLAYNVITPTGVNMVSGSITAFGFANGMANMISPASGLVVGSAQIGRTTYGNIMRGTWKYHVILFLFNAILLIIGTSFNYAASFAFF